MQLSICASKGTLINLSGYPHLRRALRLCLSLIQGLLLSLVLRQSLIDLFELIERLLHGRLGSLGRRHMSPKHGWIVNRTLDDEDIGRRIQARSAIAQKDVVYAGQTVVFGQGQEAGRHSVVHLAGDAVLLTKLSDLGADLLMHGVIGVFR